MRKRKTHIRISRICHALCILILACGCKTFRQVGVNFDSADHQKKDSQILEVINGMYEVVEWNERKETEIAG